MEIICSGFGGQGVLTAGTILIHAGANMGKCVSWSPSYGSEMRGGTANCNVVIDDEEIGSPYISRPDIVIAMNGPSIEKFMGIIKENGILIVNQSLEPKNFEYRSDIKVYRIPATKIANDINPKGINLVIIGALEKVIKYFSYEGLEQTMLKYFEERGKGKFALSNQKCLKAGYDNVIEV